MVGQCRTIYSMPFWKLTLTFINEPKVGHDVNCCLSGYNKYCLIESFLNLLYSVKEEKKTKRQERKEENDTSFDINTFTHNKC